MRLTPYAVFVLVEFYRKFNGYNRNNLSLTRSDVKGKISSATLSKKIWELIYFGFIDVIRMGRLERNCTIYALSNRWKTISQDERRLDQIQKLVKRLERIKRIKCSDAQKKRRLCKKIEIRILGKNWKYIMGHRDLE